MEAARKQLDVTVGAIAKRHDPIGGQPFLLALVTGVIVAGVTTRTVRWYVAVFLSLAAAALMWGVLMIFRVASWIRHHPLLVQMYKLQHMGGGDDANFDRIELGEAIVHHYLPPDVSEPLLERLADAQEQTARLLGLDDGEPSPQDQSGT
jgi:hypothetical protein